MWHFFEFAWFFNLLGGLFFELCVLKKPLGYLSKNYKVIGPGCSHILHLDITDILYFQITRNKSCQDTYNIHILHF